MPSLRRLAAATCLFALGALAAAAPASDVLTPHRVAELRSVGSAAISPDGSRIAYTLAARARRRRRRERLDRAARRRPHERRRAALRER